MNKVTIIEAKHVRAAVLCANKGFLTNQEGSCFDDESEEQSARRAVKVYVAVPPRCLPWWKWHRDAMLRVAKSLYLAGSRDEIYQIATLWIKNPTIGAKGANWILHVYGRRYMEQLVKIAEEISAECKVDVHVRLEAEESKDATPIDMSC